MKEKLNRLLVMLLALFMVLTVAMPEKVDAATNKSIAIGSSGYEVNNGDITAAFKKALAVAPTLGGGTLTVTIPKGTYTLNGDMPVFSNTKIIATGATINSTLSGGGSMLYGAHYDSSNKLCVGDSCTHGGYTQWKNITITGGTWNRDPNKKFTKDDTSVMAFRHGQNITITNVTMSGTTDHLLNLSGVNTAKVTGCTFKNQLDNTGTDKAYWTTYKPGTAERYDTLEAVHLDYCKEDSEANDRAKPYDNTAAQNITIDKCTFDNIRSAIGTHHPSKGGKRTGKVVITNCTATNLKSYFVYAYDFDNLEVKNNKITKAGGIASIMNSTATVSGNTYTGKGANADGKHGVWVGEGANVTISNNTITNPTFSGIRVEGNAKNKATVTGNTIKNANAHAISTTDGGTITASKNTVSGTKDGGGFYLDKSTGTFTSNTVSDVAAQGLYVKNGSKATITSNTIKNTGDVAIRVDAKTKAAIKSNSISGAKSFAVYASNNSPITLESNTIAGSGDSKPAVKVINSTSTIAANTIKSAAYHGIVVEESNNSVVRGNTIQSAEQYGIQVKNSTGVKVTSNNVKGTKKNAFHIEGESASKTASATISNNTFNTASPSSAFDMRIGTYARGCIIEPNTLVNNRDSYDSTATYTKRGSTLKSELKKVSGTWYYYTDGIKNNGFTGLVKHTNNKYYYVVKGTIKWDYTGLVKHTNGKWYYVEKGVINNSFTGLVKYNNKWWYVNKGVMVPGFTGLVKQPTNGKWYYVQKGVMNSNFTGLVKHTNGKWYYVQNGMINWNYTGLIKHTNGIWYYVEKGVINFNYTGLVKNGKWYYVQKGVLKWGYNGTVAYKGKNYTVKNSTVVS